MPDPIRALFAAHFPPTAPPPDLAAWADGVGVDVPADLAAWTRRGGIRAHTGERAVRSWLRPLAETAPTPTASAASLSAWNGFARRVEAAQQTRRFAPLYDAFGSLHRLAERDDFYLVAHVGAAGTAAFAGYEQRHDEPELASLLALDTAAFVALRHVCESAVWHGVDAPALDRFAPLLEALTGRARFAFPYDEPVLGAREAMGRRGGVASTPAPNAWTAHVALPALDPPAPLAARIARAEWLCALLRDGRRAVDEHWELRRKRGCDPTPADGWRTIDPDSPAADALYWLWRAFFAQRAEPLATLRPLLRRHRATWVRDAVALIELAQRGVRPLGHIDDLGALARASAAIVNPR